MKALVIGATGFVGGHLLRALEANNFDITATKLPDEEAESSVAGKYVNLNILSQDEICRVVEDERPDAIFHLAAQSSVALSWENPELTVDVNISGTLNLLEALRKARQGKGSRKLRMTDYRQRLLLVGSGEEYGKVAKNRNPITEDSLLSPANIYAATKACQSMLGKIYSDAYDLDIVMTRSFNHAGPGQSPAFVISDFCKQAAEIEAGIREPVISVGNLGIRRDFTDVRDVVKAYIALIDTGKKGGIYNVGSGRAIEIRKILDLIINASTAKIRIQEEESRLRPLDVPVIEADIRRITTDTEWLPEIDIETTVLDTLRYWREKVNSSKQDKS